MIPERIIFVSRGISVVSSVDTTENVGAGVTPVMHGAAISNKKRYDTVNTGRCTYTGDL